MSWKFSTCFKQLIWSLSTHVFETRTATGSELFSLLTCLHTTTVTLPSFFSPLEMISIKIWVTPLSWHAKRSFPVAVRVSKTRVLKFPNVSLEIRSDLTVQALSCRDRFSLLWTKIPSRWSYINLQCFFKIRSY